MTNEPREGQGRRTIGAGFYVRLLVSVIVTVALLTIAITGILLNHRRALGLMPDVSRSSSTLFTNAMPLAELAIRARAAGGPVAGNTDIDRMEVMPSDGLVKVRFSDPALTEVTLDIYSGKTLHVVGRRDVFIRKLHSGEVFGERAVLLSDAAAVALVFLLLGGSWYWLGPRWRKR
ncbi:MAG: PepSY domain-containing protein [Gemmatimonadaceae bacterium]